MNIVVLDNDELVAGAEFPDVEADRYGWIQYPRLAVAEIAPTCWRSHIIISLATPIDIDCLAQLKLLQLLIIGRDADALVNRSLLQARGVELLQITDVDWKKGDAARLGCERIIATINDFLHRTRQTG